MMHAIGRHQADASKVRNESEAPFPLSPAARATTPLPSVLASRREGSRHAGDIPSLAAPFPGLW